MDGTLLVVLAILLAAAVVGILFWRSARGMRMKQERNDRRSARQHRRITRQYREEQSSLGQIEKT